MMSSILLNDSIYYNNSQYQRRSQIKLEKNKLLPKINKTIKSKSNTIIIDHKYLTLRSQEKNLKPNNVSKKNPYESKLFINFLKRKIKIQIMQIIPPLINLLLFLISLYFL